MPTATVTTKERVSDGFVFLFVGATARWRLSILGTSSFEPYTRGPACLVHAADQVRVPSFYGCSSRPSPPNHRNECGAGTILRSRKGPSLWAQLPPVPSIGFMVKCC